MLPLFVSTLNHVGYILRGREVNICGSTQSERQKSREPAVSFALAENCGETKASKPNVRVAFRKEFCDGTMECMVAIYIIIRDCSKKAYDQTHCVSRMLTACTRF